MACTTRNGYISHLPTATIVHQLEPLRHFYVRAADGELELFGNDCCWSPGRRAPLFDAGLVMWDYSRSRGNLRTLHEPDCLLNTSLLEIVPFYAFPGLSAAAGDTSSPPPYSDDGKDVDVQFLGNLEPNDRRWSILYAFRDDGLNVRVSMSTFDPTSRCSCTDFPVNRSFLHFLYPTVNQKAP